MWRPVSGSRFQKVNKVPNINLTEDDLYNMSLQLLTYFNNLTEAKLKGDGLISLAEVFSRKHNIEYMELLLMVTQIYNKKEHVVHKKYKIHALKKKREVFTVKEISIIKEKLPVLH